MGGGTRISVRQPAEFGDRAGQLQDALVVNLVQHDIPVLPKAATRGAWVKPRSIASGRSWTIYGEAVAGEKPGRASVRPRASHADWECGVWLPAGSIQRARMRRDPR